MLPLAWGWMEKRDRAERAGVSADDEMNLICFDTCCVKGCVDAIDATFSMSNTPVDILVRRFSGEGSFMIAVRVKT